MEANKIILPKTDPDVVLKYAEAFLNKLQATEEYNKSKKYKEENELIEFTFSTTMVIALILLVLSLVLCLKAEGTRFVAVLTKFMLGVTLTWIVFGVFGLQIKRGLNKKHIERYKDSIKYSGFYYHIGDFFAPVSEEKTWRWRWYRDLRTLKKCAEMDGVTYVLTRTTEMFEKKIYTDEVIISCIKDGKIIYKQELFVLDDYNEKGLNEITKSPGVLDFSCYDEEYWDEYTPYYDPGFQNETSKPFIY